MQKKRIVNKTKQINCHCSSMTVLNYQIKDDQILWYLKLHNTPFNLDASKIKAKNNKKMVAVLTIVLSGWKNILSFSWECENPIKTECRGIFLHFRKARSATLFLCCCIL